MIPVYPHPRLAVPVCSHPDMLCFKINDKKWVFESSTLEKLVLPSHDITVLTDSFREDNLLEYPYDIRFNAALVGNFLFCREKYISPIILENVSAKIVDVKQGYSKCSICQVNDYSFITADKSLKKAGDKCGLDVLLISEGNIELCGYNYGFIGGASGLYENKLFFFGNIATHPDYSAIHNFIYSRGVEEICLHDGKLCDFGGLVFL